MAFCGNGVVTLSVCVCVCMCVFFCGWLSWHIAPCLPAHLMRGNSFPVILRHFVTYSSMHKQEPPPIRKYRQEMVSTFLHLRAVSFFTQHLKKVISLAAVFLFWRFFFCNCLVFSLSLALSAFCLLLWGYFIIFSGWLMIFTEKGFFTFCVFVCFAFHFVCLNYCRFYRNLLCFVCVRLFFFHY